MLQHQESKESSRGGFSNNTNSRQNSGRKVDLSNADDVPILEQRSKDSICFLDFNTKWSCFMLIFLIDNFDQVEHQDYLGNVERPKTAMKKVHASAPQFDEDATDLLPD